jgi:hypothetical protein
MSIRMGWYSLLFSSMTLLLCRPASATDLHRAEIPIYVEMIKISAAYEMQFFGIIANINRNKQIRLLLDTGSQGLVLFHTLPGVSEVGVPSVVKYYGIAVEGTRAQVTLDLQIGQPDDVEILMGRGACCSDSILEKFDGVLGVGSGGGLVNPVLGFAHQWIVDLPRGLDALC